LGPQKFLTSNGQRLDRPSQATLYQENDGYERDGSSVSEEKFRPDIGPGPQPVTYDSQSGERNADSDRRQ
jgi:hypothetical protein